MNRNKALAVSLEEATRNEKVRPRHHRGQSKEWKRTQKHVRNYIVKWAYVISTVQPFYIVRKIGSINYSCDDITKLADDDGMVASANQLWKRNIKRNKRALQLNSSSTDESTA
ncbi:unnamed protein product [Rhizophagus irregularis]|nr:unnamed protein product [Rhizophagus irregularis]